MTRSYAGDVRAFMQDMGQDVPASPQWPAADTIDMRLDLIEEEYAELLDGVVSRSLAETADAIIDLVYVALGFGHALGLPLDELWSEVHRSNISKAGGPRRPDGKVLKPEGWQPPNIIKVLLDAATRAEVQD